MFYKAALGVWLISTLIFFYFFIFDSSKDSESRKSGSGRETPPGS